MYSIERELEGFGIRLNKQPPNICFRKKEKGGVNLSCLVCFFFFTSYNCGNLPTVNSVH